MAGRLLRVTAVAGGRRSDLAVPDGVALAELVPDLARSVGLLDPAAAYAGYRVLARGRSLRPDRGLGEQGVGDGALLAVALGPDGPPPAYDDIAEATADAVGRQRPWGARDTRRALIATGSTALVLASCCALADTARDAVDGLAARGMPLGVLAAVGLVLVVLAGNGLPLVATALGVARADRLPVDPALVARLVTRSTRALVVGSGTVALLAALAAPAVARTAAGAALAADCGLVLLLRARRPRAAVLVTVDLVGGVLTLGVTAVTVVVGHPDRLSLSALVGALVGAVVITAARVPTPPAALRARVGDLLETGALVALVPLLALATDVVGRLGGA